MPEKHVLGMPESKLCERVKEQARSIGGKCILCTIVTGNLNKLEDVVTSVLGYFGPDVAEDFVSGALTDLRELGINETIWCTYSTDEERARVSLQITSRDANGELYEVDLCDFRIEPRRTTARTGGGSAHRKTSVADTWPQIRRNVLDKLSGLEWAKA